MPLVVDITKRNKVAHASNTKTRHTRRFLGSRITGRCASGSAMVAAAAAAAASTCSTATGLAPLLPPPRAALMASSFSMRTLQRQQEAGVIRHRTCAACGRDGALQLRQRGADQPAGGSWRWSGETLANERRLAAAVAAPTLGTQRKQRQRQRRRPQRRAAALAAANHSQLLKVLSVQPPLCLLLIIHRLLRRRLLRLRLHLLEEVGVLLRRSTKTASLELSTLADGSGAGSARCASTCLRKSVYSCWASGREDQEKLDDTAQHKRAGQGGQEEQ